MDIKKGEHYYMRTTRKEILEHSTSGGLVPEFLSYLLVSGRVNSALCHVSEGDTIKPYFLTDHSRVCVVCGSKFVRFQNLTEMLRDVELEYPIALVLKPCESRALKWLVKKGIVKGDVWTIGLNCGGVLDPDEASAILSTHGKSLSSIRHVDYTGEHVIYHFDDGSTLELPFSKSGIRESCKRCIVPIPTEVDLNAGYWGVKEGEKYTYVIVFTDRAREVLQEMVDKNLIEVKPVDEEGKKLRNKLIHARMQAGKLYRQHKLEWLDHINASDILNRCLFCFECWSSCPVRSGHAPLNHGTTSPVIWQMGVLNYMLDKCVECGACEDSCPVEIPFELFVQKLRVVSAKIRGGGNE